MRMLREYLIVECRNNSLTRTSGSHDKIAINTTFTYHRQLIEDLLLMWQYCVFAKHVRSNLRLSYLFQFFIEFVNASYSEILKVVTVPVNIERGKRGIDYMRILHVCHTYVPFQSIRLCRLREIARTDISSAETRVSFEDIRLGMQTFYFRIIRNTDFSIRKTRQAFHRLSVRHTAISSGDNA